MSPNSRQLTVPVGRIVKYVREQLNVQRRSHASGGSCSARQKKYRMTLPWHTMISNSCCGCGVSRCGVVYSLWRRGVRFACRWVLVRLDFFRAEKVLPKRFLDARVLLVVPFHDRGSRPPPGDGMARSREGMQKKVSESEYGQVR